MNSKYFTQGDLIFHKLYESSVAITISFEGTEIQVAPEQTVASALLAEGHLVFRNSVVRGQPRTAYCMMGVCFEYLLVIDGQTSQQACLIKVREGMEIRRQVKHL